MTIRANAEATTKAKYPGTSVLSLNEFRVCLGIGSPQPTEQETTPDTDNKSLKMLLLGHNIVDDFNRLHAEGVHLDHVMTYTGIVDTEVYAENANIPKSLSSLMSRYDFAELVPSESKCKGTKMVFDGAHNAGNDAVATLKVALAQALDSELGGYGYYEDDGETEENGWEVGPLENIDPTMVLLANDCEHVESDNYIPNIENRTTEIGFASLSLRDVIGIPPGINGENWHPMIKAKHFVNKIWSDKNYKNKLYCAGNPKDFRHGQSEYYKPNQSPHQVHAYFKELANPTAAQRSMIRTAENKKTFEVRSNEFPTLGGTGRLPRAENKSSTWSSGTTSNVNTTSTPTSNGSTDTDSHHKEIFQPADPNKGPPKATSVETAASQLASIKIVDKENPSPQPTTPAKATSWAGIAAKGLPPGNGSSSAMPLTQGPSSNIQKPGSGIDDERSTNMNSRGNGSDRGRGRGRGRGSGRGGGSRRGRGEPYEQYF